MAGKLGRSSWVIVTELMAQIERDVSDPVERWGMFKGIVYMKITQPQRGYMQKYNAKRRAEEKKHAQVT